jgi:hypothetical protein
VQDLSAVRHRFAGLPAVQDGHAVAEDDGAFSRRCADHPGAAKEEETPWCHSVGFKP